MSIPINTLCIECHLKKRFALARSLGTDEQANTFARKILKEISEAPPEMDSTWLASISDRILKEIYDLDPNRLKAEKEFSNKFVLERLPEIYGRIEKAKDPLYCALQFAVLGNYLDFSALHGELSFDKFSEMLDAAEHSDLDKETYQKFCRDLEKGKNLLYIVDNAGEVVFDRVLAEKIHEKYPHLQITFSVRGGPVTNDATREDAAVAGITFPVIDSGVAICGTVLPFIGQELKQAIEDADVILAKGMGNTESLWGSDFNIYYAFLVKCIRFEQVFNKPKLTPMFVQA